MNKTLIIKNKLNLTNSVLPNHNKKSYTLNNFLLQTSKNTSTVNVPLTLNVLQKVTSIISEITATKGFVLIDHPEKITNNPLKEHFLKKEWPNGLISNYKETAKQHKALSRLPNFIFISQPKLTKMNDIIKELNLNNIAFGTFSDIELNTTSIPYPITGNINSKQLNKHYKNLLIRAISVGYLRETFLLKNAEVDPEELKDKDIQNISLLPRLDLNQRPLD